IPATSTTSWNLSRPLRRSAADAGEKLIGRLIFLIRPRVTTFEHSSVNGRCAAVASSQRTDPDIALFNRSSRSRLDAVTALGAVVRRDAERESVWICCRGPPPGRRD